MRVRVYTHAQTVDNDRLLPSRITMHLTRENSSAIARSKQKERRKSETAIEQFSFFDTTLSLSLALHCCCCSLPVNPMTFRLVIFVRRNSYRIANVMGTALLTDRNVASEDSERRKIADRTDHHRCLSLALK